MNFQIKVQIVMKYASSWAQSNSNACKVDENLELVNLKGIALLDKARSISGIDFSANTVWHKVVVENDTNLGDCRNLMHEFSCEITENEARRFDCFLNNETVRILVPREFAQGFLKPSIVKGFYGNEEFFALNYSIDRERLIEALKDRCLVDFKCVLNNEPY